jgi:NADPH:quinone reductase-like Zn-dependent oxidoreductase
MTLAVTYSLAGDPADTLEVSEVDAPPPPGRGEIQVQVSAFPIHPGDLFTISAAPPRSGEASRAGLEAAGTVRDVGPAVTEIVPGTRVAFFPHPGSWAQRVNIPADLAVPVPDELPDEVAAQLVCNPVTALLLHRAAQQHFSIGFDGLIVNNAAASSVGRLVTAYALDHHIASVSVVRSAARAQQLSQESPAVPVVSTDTPGWPEKVREAAGGRPITAIVDPVGGQIASELFALLTPGGTLITYGQLSGESVTLDPAVLMAGSGQRGLTIGRWLSATSPEQRASDVAAAVDLVLTHQQLLQPAAVYPLDELTTAVQRVSAPGKVGAVVIRI